VDSSGNVSAAEFDSRGPSNYFAQAALTASRRWRFTPASSEWVLRFEFSRAGLQVSAVRTNP
jgi:outer membrane biosynthesis protein TonB